MDDPWQFLILDQHTATERDVKAAYARLLKQHRPDQDPEGFQKLRRAYEAALAAVARRDAGQANERQPSYAVPESSAKDRVEAAQGPLPFREEMLPAAVQEAFSTLRHSVGSGNEEQMQAAVAAFQTACGSVNVSASLLAQALQDVFHSDGNLTARGMTNDVMVYLAEKGQINFCHVVVSAWETDDQRMRLATLGAALLKRAGLLASQDGATLMARVGMLSGLEFPQVAAALGNAAFPHLAVEGREQFIGQLEQQVLLGRIFSDVPPDTQPFWFHMLRKNAAERDWSSQEAKRALKATIEQNRFGWKGWGVVRQIMPPEQWANVERTLQEQARKAGGGSSKQRPVKLATVMTGLIMALMAMIRVFNQANIGEPRWNTPLPSVRQKLNQFDLRPLDPKQSSSIYDRIYSAQPITPSTTNAPNRPPVTHFSQAPGPDPNGFTSLGHSIESRNSLSSPQVAPTVTINSNTPLSRVPPVPTPASPSQGPSINDVIKGAQQQNQSVIITLPSGQRVPLSNLTPATAK